LFDGGVNELPDLLDVMPGREEAEGIGYYWHGTA